MKTLKVMSIISIILSVLAALFLEAEYATDEEWLAALAAVELIIFYLLSFAIVVLVKSNKKESSLPA